VACDYVHFDAEPTTSYLHVLLVPENLAIVKLWHS